MMLKISLVFGIIDLDIHLIMYSKLFNKDFPLSVIMSILFVTVAIMPSKQNVIFL